MIFQKLEKNIRNQKTLALEQNPFQLGVRKNIGVSRPDTADVDAELEDPEELEDPALEPDDLVGNAVGGLRHCPDLCCV